MQLGGHSTAAGAAQRVSESGKKRKANLGSTWGGGSSEPLICDPCRSGCVRQRAKSVSHAWSIRRPLERGLAVAA